jgi:tRNA A58 N-methylase Trm61
MVSVIAAIVCVPVAFVAMVGTGSAVLTIGLALILPASGLVIGICEVAKGIIEARGIMAAPSVEPPRRE